MKVTLRLLKSATYGIIHTRSLLSAAAVANTKAAMTPAKSTYAPHSGRALGASFHPCGSRTTRRGGGGGWPR